MALIDDVKKVLRISNTAYDTEVTDLIAAAKSDLSLAGVYKTMETDSLIKRAISIYVKANFGYNNPDAERLLAAYESLKSHLTLSSDYAYYAVTFTVNDGTDPIAAAIITFDGVVKYTSILGVAVFYAIAGNNYEYRVDADGYEAEEDYTDVTAATSITVSLEAG